jgi:hypothetical protein
VRRSRLLTAVLLTAALAGGLFLARGSRAHADTPSAITYAVFGDAPYGAKTGDITQVLRTPAFVANVNADPDVSRIIHVGDIHSGKDHCSQAYDQDVLDLWQGVPFAISGNRTNADGTTTALSNEPVSSAGFDDPLVYTPGDNEWTDCNKPGEGGLTDGYYDASQAGHLPGDPLDNLALVRSLFFPTAGTTLGKNPVQVTSQATAGPAKYRSFVENTRWEADQVMFVTLNLPGGSNNDQTPWYGLPVTQRQLDEKALRTAADLQWLIDAYNLAAAHGDKGVLIATQADMWDPEAPLDQYDSIVNRIAQLSRDFAGKVLLINGDSHVFKVDNPLNSVDPSFQYHPQKKSVNNFTRIVVHGSTLPLEWLKLTIDPSTPDVFSWQEVQVP